MTGTFAVIANLEAGADGYTMATLPLHVTLLTIFESTLDSAQLNTIVGAVAAANTAFDVPSLERALFGVNEDVPVTRVVRSPALFALHSQLLSEVKDHARFRTPQFTGDGYGPHVTDQGERCLAVGETARIDNLTLVEISGEDVIELLRAPLGVI